MPKLTIPSPSMVHYRGGRAAVDETVYPDLDEFWADLASAYADEVQRLDEHGCRYLQFDDTSLAYLNDPKQREKMAAKGGGPRPPARDLHPPHQPRARGPAGGHDGRRPTCAAATSAPPGSPRAATTSSPRRCSTSSTSTGTSWSGTTSAPAASSRCASCRRASTSCSGSSPPSAASSRARTTLKRRIEEASKLRRPRPALPLAAVRLLVDRRGQRPHGRAAGREAAPRHRGRRGSVGLGDGLRP